MEFPCTKINAEDELKNQAAALEILASSLGEEVLEESVVRNLQKREDEFYLEKLAEKSQGKQYNLTIYPYL